MYGLPTVATDRGFPDGGSDLPILMDDVICIGNESRLIDCMHKSENGSNCVHSEDVGLECGGGFARDMEQGEKRERELQSFASVCPLLQFAEMVMCGWWEETVNSKVK